MLIRKRKVLTLLVVTALVLALLAGCGGGGGGGEAGGGGDDGPITMRLASNAPLDHMSNALNEEAVEMIYERTDGRVRVTYHPASQLGDYVTVYEEVMMGVVDFMHGTIPDSVDARLGAAYMPYYAMGYEDLPALYGEGSYLFNVMHEISASQGIEFMGFLIEGFIGMGVVTEPNDEFVPGAPKGIKMRAPGALIALLFPVEDLGYTAVTVPYAEVPTAIQTGVVDGWNGGTPNMNYAWLSDIITTMYVNYMHAECTAYIGSTRSLDKLSPEDREIVIDVFLEQSAKSFYVAEENEKDYMRRLEAAGIRVVDFTYEQRRAHADFVRENTWPRLEAEFTKELIDNFRAEADRVQN